MKRTIFGILILAGACTTPSGPHLNMFEAAATLQTYGAGGEDRDPKLSPDGEWLYYATTSYSTRYDVYRKRPGSNLVSRVTTAATDERFPTIHPENPNTLAFSSNLNGEWDIFVIEDLEENPELWTRVSEEGTHDIHPSWSPDGTQLVYCSSGGLPNDPWILKVIDMPTGTTYILEQVDGLLPSWSPVPGDDRIVFQRMSHRGNWFASIWTVRFRRGMAQELTLIYGDGEWAAINPEWSPDGSRIAFATVAKSPHRSEKTDEGDDIWTISVDGTNPMQITRAPSAEWMPDWGIDGLIYFISRREATPRVWSIKPDTLPIRPGAEKQRVRDSEHAKASRD